MDTRTGWEFLDYAIFYPEADEDGFDGIHHGGVKTLHEDAPEWAWEQYRKLLRAMENGIVV